MEPMRLHADGMGRAVCTSRPYKQAIPNSHPVLFGKPAGDRFGAPTSITARTLDHSLSTIRYKAASLLHKKTHAFE